MVFGVRSPCVCVGRIVCKLLPFTPSLSLSLSLPYTRFCTQTHWREQLNDLFHARRSRDAGIKIAVSASLALSLSRINALGDGLCSMQLDFIAFSPASISLSLPFLSHFSAYLVGMVLDGTVDQPVPCARKGSSLCCASPYTHHHHRRRRPVRGCVQGCTHGSGFFVAFFLRFCLILSDPFAAAAAIRSSTTIARTMHHRRSDGWWGASFSHEIRAFFAFQFLPACIGDRRECVHHSGNCA